MFINKVAIKQIKDWFLQHPTEESCGIILKDSGLFVPCRNVLSKEGRKTGFQIEAAKLCKYAGRIGAVAHSHIGGPDYPSVFDQERQIETAAPWIIGVVNSGRVSDMFQFGNGESLDSAPFRHAVSDCYELVRNWYAGREVKLPPIVREWEWWKSEGILESGFSNAGFYKFDPGKEEPGVGDLAVIGVKSDVPHHCAIYVGNGAIYHHPGGAAPFDPTRYPREENISRWRKHIKFWLRHRDLKII